ncbi:hypothetical protein L208DRAFT_1461014 [Tricholoma matsutake]|nr:hypothetical protein L208DRAFT_1461014 [Tricholoma matsutake 945]
MTWLSNRPPTLCFHLIVSNTFGAGSLRNAVLPFGTEQIFERDQKMGTTTNRKRVQFHEWAFAGDGGSVDWTVRKGYKALKLALRLALLLRVIVEQNEDDHRPQAGNDQSKPNVNEETMWTYIPCGHTFHVDIHSMWTYISIRPNRHYL